MKKVLSSGWSVLQDIYDSAEKLAIQSGDLNLTDVGRQLSEWEPIDRLMHLQVLLSDTPYWGRELRYFNQAPWWYRNIFEAKAAPGEHTRLRFTNVDYFCKVWLNGKYLGDHEGYSTPFEFDVTDTLQPGDNTLLVKVWSPWDDTVHGDALDIRAFAVERELVKGTYEHDDTLIARDVNPIGIYGAVEVISESGPRFSGIPRISYALSDDFKSARVTVRGSLSGPAAATTQLKLEVFDAQSLQPTFSESFTLKVGQTDAPFDISFDVADLRNWSVWDHGGQTLYGVSLALAGGESMERRIGFRKIELRRDTSETTFVLNGRPLFIRGTSYFPDVYLSTVTRERYLRDLQAIRTAGFNCIRVHVHVENRDFYDLCDELGLAVMQDSEFNWTHPIAASWADRFIAIYEQTILMLDDHPALCCWICLNEPGVFDPEGRTHGYAMEKSPGPALYAAVTALDPSRPVIKGSYCDDDPTSGDSHNYAGSLMTPGKNYLLIDGTTEKLNTEFGFDAPGSLENLRQYKRLFKRIALTPEFVAELQAYQYRLLKYYTEHYRAQKYRPCSGYVQFMFIDISPQSFYGIYDWWGQPKASITAMRESNQPLLGMIEQTAAKATGVLLINDSLEDLGMLTVRWFVRDAAGMVLASGSKSVTCGPDSSQRVCDFAVEGSDARGEVQAAVAVYDARGSLICTNRYFDMFGHPAHPEGHPLRMSHEFGVRLYGA